MPLVVSDKSRRIYLIRDEDCLGEILGHTNFDGFDWAIGDLIVFEDGTTSSVVQAPDEPETWHLWSKPVPTDLEEVLRRARGYDQRLLDGVTSWESLFGIFASEVIPPPLKRSWFGFGK